MIISDYSLTSSLDNYSFDISNLDPHFLVKSDCIATLTMFISSGGNVNNKNSNGDTLLHTAVQHNNIAIAEVLLNDPSIDLDGINQNGETALFSVQSEEMLDLLIENCFDLEVENFNGFSPIHFAAKSDNNEVLVALINKYKANPNQKNHEGVTPLHLAAEKNHFTSVDILLQFGADVNAQTLDGLTPLHFAARAGHKDMRTANLLIGPLGNARYNMKTKNGKTALDLALENIRENRLNSREHPTNEVGTCILLAHRINAAKFKRVTTSITFPKIGKARTKRQGSPLVPLNSPKRKKI